MEKETREAQMKFFKDLESVAHEKLMKLPVDVAIYVFSKGTYLENPVIRIWRTQYSARAIIDNSILVGKDLSPSLFANF